MSNEIIRFENFSYSYEDCEELALKGVNLSISEGDFIGIIGCNKAGKTTLCQAMVGVLPYVLGGRYEGSVYINKKSLDETHGEAAANVVGIVFQDSESQFTQETIEDEIAFAMCNFGYKRELMRERVEEAARACGLMDMLSRSPFQLSGGQQQRLAVACILALRPEVIILDESTSQLDPVGRDEVFTLIKQLHKYGSTVIMVDHNVEKIAEYADKIIVMHEGGVYLTGTSQEVFSNCDALEKINIRVPQVTKAAQALLGGELLPVYLQQAKQSFKKYAGKTNE